MQSHGHMSKSREVPVETLPALMRKDAKSGDYDLDWIAYSKDNKTDGYSIFYGNTVWILSAAELQKLFELMPEVKFHERPWDDDEDWEPPSESAAEKVVEKLLSEENVPKGSTWVIRVDGSVSNRPDYYGPFSSHADANREVEQIPEFEKNGDNEYSHDTGSETVDIVTGYLPPGDKGLKRMRPARQFKVDWQWLSTGEQTSTDTPQTDSP